MRHHQRGFTLIEIAIVLVIIGLLLGGVLKGQELINQAKIKNVANDLNGVTVAVYAYQDRYKRLPGDDPGTNTRWAGFTQGDGSNVIGAANTGYSIDGVASENRLFWAHLRKAGLIAGDSSTLAAAVPQPLNASGGIMGVQHSGLGLNGPIVCTGSLPGKIAQAVDSQFDDGNAITGSVRGIPENPPPAAVTADVPVNNYVDDGSTLYVICKNI